MAINAADAQSYRFQSIPTVRFRSWRKYPFRSFCQRPIRLDSSSGQSMYKPPDHADCRSRIRPHKYPHLRTHTDLNYIN